MGYKIAFFGLSDRGLVRKNNEDVWQALSDLNLYVVADGMGGHQAGEVAAHEAVQTLCKIVHSRFGNSEEKTAFHDMRKAFKLAIQQVNSHVYDISCSNTSLKGMGTTLCSLYFHEKGVVYAHVGDSRIYRLRKRRLEQLTKDHSLVRELVDQGQISEKEGQEFLYKNIITKAIGTEAAVEPSVHLSDVEEGDVYLMCTDGLSDQLSTKEIQNILNHAMNIEQGARELVISANARGGYDNITLVLIKLVKGL